MYYFKFMIHDYLKVDIIDLNKSLHIWLNDYFYCPTVCFQPYSDQSASTCTETKDKTNVTVLYLQKKATVKANIISHKQQKSLCFRNLLNTNWLQFFMSVFYDQNREKGFQIPINSLYMDNKCYRVCKTSQSIIAFWL